MAVTLGRDAGSSGALGLKVAKGYTENDSEGDDAVLGIIWGNTSPAPSAGPTPTPIRRLLLMRLTTELPLARATVGEHVAVADQQLLKLLMARQPLAQQS